MDNKIDFKKNIIFFQTLDSTNDFLKREFENLSNHTVVVAEYQTHGRGQFERVWESNAKENLLCSILIRDDHFVVRKMMNPLIVSALIASLNEYGIEATYKAPNDIYVGEDKIAGVLIETKYENTTMIYTIVGIGLNVNQTDFQTPNATSIKKVTGKVHRIQSVLEKMLTHISNYLFMLTLSEAI